MGNVLVAPVGSGAFAAIVSIVVLGLFYELRRLNKVTKAIHTQVVINRKRPNLIGWNLKDDVPNITAGWKKKDPTFQVLPTLNERSQADVSSNYLTRSRK